MLFVSPGVKTVRPAVLKDGPSGAANDGHVTTISEYDRENRMTFMVEDDGDVFEYQYDGADRQIAGIDPERNRMDYTFDDNDNITKIVETEVTQEGNTPSLTEQFTTINVYDSLDRLERTTDNIGQTNRFVYDSRDNLIFTSDAQGKKTSDELSLFKDRINQDGNTINYFYDGINRRIRDEKDLRKGGQGSGAIDTTNPSNPDGKITVTIEYDKDSRIVAMTDDNGNRTSYDYDNLNRKVLETFADGTTNKYEYDRDHNIVKMIDENGSVIDCGYDALNRLTQKDVTRAPGIIGTTQQTCEYDGLSRSTLSFDNNDPVESTDDATVTYAYDSLSRLIEEVQNGQAVSSQWDGDNNRLALIYPNGRKIGTVYDRLDRIDTIKNSGSPTNIVDYDYIGPGRFLERTYMNGVRLSYLDDKRTKDIGYDGIKRRVKHRHLTENNTLIAGFEYGYDREDNKLFETRLHEFNGRKNIGDVYEYDSIYRLITFKRDVVNPKLVSLLDHILNRSRSAENQTTYTLDGVGNWANLAIGDQSFTNTINEMNEYDSFKGPVQIHDDNGDLVQDEQFMYEYDFANRLRRVIRNSDGENIGQYNYDAHRANSLMRGSGRRIAKVVSNSSDLDDNVRYLHDIIHCIEEQRTDGSAQQYVYGMRIDEPLTMDKDNNGDGNTDGTFFYHCDAKTYVTAMSDSSGNVVERYTYDAYGQPSMFDSLMASIPSSQIANPYLFTGRRFDQETGLHYYRARYFHPVHGRFIQRDIIDIWGDAGNVGNAYVYVGNNPSNSTDPLGDDAIMEMGIIRILLESRTIRKELKELADVTERTDKEFYGVIYRDKCGKIRIIREKASGLTWNAQLLLNLSNRIENEGNTVEFTFHVHAQSGIAPETGKTTWKSYQDGPSPDDLDSFRGGFMGPKHIIVANKSWSLSYQIDILTTTEGPDRKQRCEVTRVDLDEKGLKKHMDLIRSKMDPKARASRASIAPVFGSTITQLPGNPTIRPVRPFIIPGD